MNSYLNDIMEGLSAKVFRTYNASRTLQEQLDQMTNVKDNLNEKLLAYNRANRAVAIDVAVVNFGCEGHLGRLERVVGREVNVEEKHSLMVRRALRSHDCRLPVELVSFVRRAG